MKTTAYENVALVGFATTLMAIQFIFFHGGYFGYDEIWYGKIAASILEGRFTHFHLYAFRYATFLPLTAIYSIFGINDFSNFFFNVAFHWVTLYIVLQFLKKYDVWTKFVAVIFYSCMPIITMYLEKPMPDVVVMTGFTMMVYGYYLVNFKIHASRIAPIIWFIIGAILVFLAKETFLIFYPIFIVLLAKDAIQRKNKYFWIRTITTILIFGILYALANYFYFGDPLIRVKTIFAFTYVHDCSYDVQPMSVLLKRITTDLWLSFIRNVILLPVIFLPLLWYNPKDRIFQFLFKLWIACMVLANFMTISYSSYVPLCPDPRHFMFAFPIGTIVFAIGFNNLQKNIKSAVFACIVLLLMLWIAVVNLHENTWYLYVPLILGIVSMYFSHRRLAITMFSLGLISMYMVHLLYNKKVNYPDQKKLTSYVLDQAKKKSIVVTDGANATISTYIAQYDTSLVRFVDFKEFDTLDTHLYKEKWLIMNGMTRYLSNQNWEELPVYAKTAHEKLEKIYSNDSGDVYIIDAQK